MALKGVEMIRKNAVLASRFAVQRVRIYTSSLDGNHDAVTRIQGDGETELVGRLVEVILEHMGHETELKAEGARATESKARRAARQGQG